MRILLVEDSATLNEALVRSVRQQGWVCDSAADGLTALQFLTSYRYDAVLLDLMLPCLDGWGVLRKLRTAGQAVPVLVISARDQVADRVQALDNGADDYLVKPFALDELLARLRALLRRSQAATTSILTLGALSIDTAAHQVMADGQSLDVGPREWTVLQYLMLHAPKPVSKEKLLQSLTGWDKEITPNAVEVYISRLRAKLEPYGIALRSIRGFGYRIEQRTN